MKKLFIGLMATMMISVQVFGGNGESNMEEDLMNKSKPIYYQLDNQLNYYKSSHFDKSINKFKSDDDLITQSIIYKINAAVVSGEACLRFHLNQSNYELYQACLLETFEGLNIINTSLEVTYLKLISHPDSRAKYSTQHKQIATALLEKLNKANSESVYQHAQDIRGPQQ